MGGELLVVFASFSIGMLGVGIIIGGLIVNKINRRQKNDRVAFWKNTADLFREQLMTEYEKNVELTKALESREA